MWSSFSFRNLQVEGLLVSIGEPRCIQGIFNFGNTNIIVVIGLDRFIVTFPIFEVLNAAQLYS